MDTDDLTKAVLATTKKSGKELVEALSQLVTDYGATAVGEWRSNSQNKDSIMHIFVRLGLLEGVSYLVGQGLDINAQRTEDGCTPLHLAAWFKRSDMISLLLGLGADPSIKNKYNENCEELILMREKQQNMIWLDLELTSLDDPEVLECTVIITDKDLVEVC
eukprot:TRINITY_DN4513_c0_g1_i7.p1 TRINITY_DN4513_c0_g1~~TRINITY_DN4513_c0_g1_i7.p1  ORF type:complete len:162 (-),score=26.94 TRINITY_DN4513_c0_g1_i7:599-1084(-)